MSGSATLTIVMSSSSMNTPVQTAVSVHHFGSRPARAGIEGLVTPPSSHLLGLDLAAQLQHLGAVILLDLVRRVLRRAEPRDAHAPDPADHRARVDGGHLSLGRAGT